MGSWLVKSEPEVYAFETLQKEGKTRWDGVRNFTARNNLRAMKKGDQVLYYHSSDERAVVGVAKVLTEAYPDPTAKEGDWSCVDLGPVRALGKPVSLATIKTTPALAKMVIVRQSRLSVSPVTDSELAKILQLGG